MKSFVHPTHSSTIVQRKDGSTVRKEWLYFRTALVLEGESKAWSTLLGVKRPQLTVKIPSSSHFEGALKTENTKSVATSSTKKLLFLFYKPNHLWLLSGNFPPTHLLAVLQKDAKKPFRL